VSISIRDELVIDFTKKEEHSLYKRGMFPIAECEEELDLCGVQLIFSQTNFSDNGKGK